MPENKVLNNGVSIPMLGLGVFRISGEETKDAVRDALQLGYRHIDTAAIYGNEAEVGEGLRASGVPREEVFITTKLWNEDMRQGRVKEAMDESLKKLGLDYVDLYLVHWPVRTKFIKSYLAMEELLKAGKTRAIGVSNFNEHHVKELMEQASVVPAVNQVERNPHFTQIPLLQYCAEMDIAVEAYGPFGGTGVPVLKDPVIERIAEKHGKTPAQVVLRWDIQQGVIVLPKSAHKDRIASNMQVDFRLDDDDMKAIDDLNTGRRYYDDPETFNF